MLEHKCSVFHDFAEILIPELEQRNVINDIVRMQDGDPPYVATSDRQVLQ